MTRHRLSALRDHASVSREDFAGLDLVSLRVARSWFTRTTGTPPHGRNDLAGACF
jgi:hypothetical protein